MKILFLGSNLTFSPRDGMQRNNLQLLNSLSQSFGPIDVISFVEEEITGEKPNFINLIHHELRPSLVNHFKNVFLNRLTRTRSQFENTLIETLRKETYDVIIFDGVAVVSYINFAQNSSTILNFIDPLSRRFFRFSVYKFKFSSIKMLFLGIVGYMLEIYFLRRFDKVVVVSEEDKNFLRKYCFCEKVVNIPVFSPIIEFEAKSIKKDIHDIVILSDLRFSHMVDSIIWFDQRVLSSLYKEVNVNVHLVAKNASEIKDKFNLNCLIQCHDWIEDLDDFLAKSKIVVVPDIVGTGIKNRVVHAMSLGIAVVGTRVAFEGIPFVNFEDAMVFDSAEKIKNAIIELIRDEILRNNIGHNGQKTISAYFSQSRVSLLWESMIKSVLG